MLSGGDEVGRTQRGNNNGYCQDSELTWTPWDAPREEQAFYEFVAAAHRAARARSPSCSGGRF